MSERYGPTMRVIASCYGCSYNYSNRVYLPAVPPEEDPDGLAPEVRDDHYCRALEGDGPCRGGKLIDNKDGTPKWCPFLPIEINKLIISLRSEPKP